MGLSRYAFQVLNNAAHLARTVATAQFHRPSRERNRNGVGLNCDKKRSGQTAREHDPEKWTPVF
jgi:hypothetical protein